MTDPIPELGRTLVFGAAGHIGGPAASYVGRTSPATTLRLVTSAPNNRAAMQASHRRAELVVANYFDPASLRAALEGVDRVLMITPPWSDDRTATENLVVAAQEVSPSVKIVRIIGDPPGVRSEDDIPKVLREWGGGAAVQHLQARAILAASGLPVIFVNIASQLMTNFLRGFGAAIRMHRILTVPYDRRMGFIDPFDVGEAAGALLVSNDPRHLGKTYHLDNGHDVLLFSEVADLMSDVLGEKITFNSSPEAFVEINGEIMRRIIGRDDAPEYYLEYFKWERELSTMWRRTDVLEYLLGREGKTLRAWLEENKSSLLGRTAS